MALKLLSAVFCVVYADVIKPRLGVPVLLFKWLAPTPRRGDVNWLLSPDGDNMVCHDAKISTQALAAQDSILPLGTQGIIAVLLS